MVAKHKTRFTKTYIDGCTDQGFYWDAALPGFGFWITGQGTKTYFVQARVNGRDKRHKIGRHGICTLDQARLIARDTLNNMAQGQDPRETARAKTAANTTLNNAFEAFLEQRRLKARTISDYQGYMRRYFSKWAEKPITGITPMMIQERYRELAANYGSAQANVSMRFVRALFNYIEGKYLDSEGESLVRSNPTKCLSGLKLWIKPVRRTQYVKEEQLSQWLEAVLRSGMQNVDFRDFLLFTIFTGLRRNESISLKWEDVNFVGKSFAIPDTKNGTRHELPLTSFTHDLLARRQAGASSEFVFPGRGKTGHLVEPKKAIERVVADSGIEFTVHDLRRSYVTYADAVIPNQSTIKRLVNHLSGNRDVTEGYKQGIARLRAPAQDVTDHIFTLIGPRLMEVRP